MKAKAVANAKQNAKAMTNAIDQTLGKAIFIPKPIHLPMLYKAKRLECK